MDFTYVTNASGSGRRCNKFASTSKSPASSACRTLSGVNIVKPRLLFCALRRFRKESLNSERDKLALDLEQGGRRRPIAKHHQSLQ
jgi:hypothetical protein